MIKKILILAFLVLTVLTVRAQDQYQFNHYIANQGILNPAYNGTRDIISGLLIHRNQWLGFEGAPMNQALNVHGPIEDTDLGVGLVLVNDNIGFSNTFDAFGAVSYKLQLDSRDRFISFGLQAGVSSLVYDGTKAVVEEYGDPVFYSKESKFALNFGFGAYFYSDTYFIGFSIPKFFSNQFDNDAEKFKNQLDPKNMHTYLYGGYVFELEDVRVKPTLLMKQVYGAPMQFDISANVMFMDRLWLGLSYRTISDVVFLGEYIINDQFTVRYSFDYPISKLNQFNNYGTHEISLQFDFSFSKRPGMRSIRYF
ncbi:PorP/SprF family type IX secretion system membrane protein [Marinilabilia salmonicolor]|uniref:PorP/SprF family type IX secretion system membrane protein n=1 Tax=Marinilabilia salmonicolor TaxID=989 RepID=UPI00029A4DBD|nr:type IX secretion system membrane protein PorP/SprF [Marinilabilia salmonicolor]